MQLRSTGWWLIVATFVIFGAIRPSAARAECATFDGTLHWTATLTHPGYALWVDLHGDRAFVIRRSDLWVIDVANPYAPSASQPLDLEGDIWGATLHGDLWLAVGDRGLFVISIEDPAFPRLLAVLPPASDEFRAVAARGRYAYVGTTHGIEIVDLIDPSHPSVVDNFETASAVRRLTFAGDALCILQQNVLLLLDVSDPSAPRPLGSAAVPGSARALCASEAFVYIVADDQLHVFEIADPRAPQLVHSVAHFNTSLASIDCWNGIAVVSGSEGLRTFDLSDPRSPRLVGRFDCRYQFFVAGVDDGLVVVGESESGLHVFELGNGRTISSLGSIPGDSQVPYYNPYSVAALGRFAYTADPFGLTVVDVGTAPPRVVARLPQGCLEVFLDGDRGVFGDGGSYWALDTTDPSNPRQGARMEGTSIVLRSPWVFIATDSLQVLDISDVDAPRTVSSLELPEEARLSFEQGYLYVIMRHACWVMDISDPMSPRILRKVPGERPSRLVGDGSIAYYPAGYGGIEVYDATDRAAPIPLRTIRLAGDVLDLELHAGQLLAANDWCGIQIFDLADPSIPRCIGHMETAGEARDLAVATNCLLVASNNAGLELVPLPCAATPVTVQDFVADIGHGVVHLSWRLEDADVLTEIRLRGRAGEVEWEVPFIAQGLGEYSAADEVGLAFVGRVRYELAGRESHSHWVTLASREVVIPEVDERRSAFHVGPNPAHGSVAVQFTSHAPRTIDVAVFGVDGRRVATIAAGRFPSGPARFLWAGTGANGQRVPTGVYWVRMRAGEQMHSRKILLVR